jgi:hypothetical protein
MNANFAYTKTVMLRKTVYLLPLLLVGCDKDRKPGVGVGRCANGEVVSVPEEGGWAILMTLFVVLFVGAVVESWWAERKRK